MASTVSRRHLLISSARQSAMLLPPAVGTAATEPTPRSPVAPISRITSVSESGRWEDYSREREPTTDVVQTVEFVLSSSTAGGGVDLILIADVITISGKISLPGRNVTLAARKVIAKEGSTVDCSGESGTAHRNRADDGRTPGADGKDGATGDRGKRGGDIRVAAGEIVGPLHLRSNGGDGAKGQTGGTGAIGQTGDAGSSADEFHGPQHGARGKKGATGGSGGRGGDGGATGLIAVSVTGPLPPQCVFELCQEKVAL